MTWQADACQYIAPGFNHSLEVCIRAIFSIQIEWFGCRVPDQFDRDRDRNFTFLLEDETPFIAEPPPPPPPFNTTHESLSLCEPRRVGFYCRERSKNRMIKRMGLTLAIEMSQTRLPLLWQAALFVTWIRPWSRAAEIPVEWCSAHPHTFSTALIPYAIASLSATDFTAGNIRALYCTLR
ncbi:hypothetical protein EVAR_54397_1 [Eumeta japonica]|uniref:Uncharacterized protein n=1 Tax=Eumeta variegata TaxID=151549 RepID=A0A4C1Y7Q9_EUMVA|nr:hypothetical protein EVAR_54397_1 [Eumeta japonica]